MTEKFLSLAIIVCVCAAVQGCTYRAWYEGLRERQRLECQKQINHDEVQRCLDHVAEMTYEQYVRSREVVRR